MACVLTPVFYLVVEKLTGIEAPGDRLVSHSNKKAPDAGQQLQRGWKKLFQSPILRYTIILFLCWLPVFLAVYPGFFAYDATEELQGGADRTVCDKTSPFTCTDAWKNGKRHSEADGQL